MALLIKMYYLLHDGVFSLFAKLDGLAPLLMRLYLAPVLIIAGLHKYHNIDGIAAWLGGGLGLPYPEIMALLVTYVELVGGFMLLLGLAVRWVSVPLMVVMLVAAFTVHWENGWFAIAPTNIATSAAKPLADLHIPQAQASLENSLQVAKRLDRVSDILAEHGNLAWLTEKGPIAVLNNGIEFAATYFIMLLSLFFTGAGRGTSLDYFLDRRARQILAERRVKQQAA